MTISVHEAFVYRPDLLSPLHKKDIRRIGVHKNRIDRVNTDFSKGTRYEDTCFNILAYADESPSSLTIGPHLIDYIFGSHNSTSWFVRPDSFFLQRRGNAARIVGAAEFKSGEHIGYERKLEGFAQLFTRLRKQPELLPTLLQSAVGRYVDVPRRIGIPPLEELHILFVAPFAHGVVYIPEAPFAVAYRQVE